MNPWVTPVNKFCKWEQTVQTEASCLRLANQRSTRTLFSPTLRRSMSMCLKSRVRAPRGPFTLTMRDLISHSTVKKQKFWKQCVRFIKAHVLLKLGILFSAKNARYAYHTIIVDLPPSGMSIVRDARTVFIFVFYIYWIGVAGQFAGAIIILTMSNAPEEKAWMRASPSSSLDLHLGLVDFAISAYFHFMTTLTSQNRGEKSRIDVSII